MSLIDDEEVVICGFLQAFLEAALGVDRHQNFINDPSEFALSKLAEKACGGTYFCLEWEGGFSEVIYVFEERLYKFRH